MLQNANELDFLMPHSYSQYKAKLGICHYINGKKITKNRNVEKYRQWHWS